MDIILEILAYFVIYSIIGWIMESIFVFLNSKKLINRGFLIGPYCPIYGFGAVLMILYLTQYRDNVLTVFILGLVICSFLEYLTSYLMEKCFKTRWWDYSDHAFNLNGRICGKNCLLFGIGGLVIIYFTQPIVSKFIKWLPSKLYLVLTILISIIILIDFIVSLSIGLRFKKTLTLIDLKKDSTQEFTKMVRDTLINNHKIFQKRLINAFPNIDFIQIKRHK